MMDIENTEDLPVQPEDTRPQEITEDDSDIFEYKPAKLPYNPFLTRGCCHAPKLFQKNDLVFQHRCSKFDSFDWLKDIPVMEGTPNLDLVEVRFKNSRKDYFRMPPDMDLAVGEIIAVEASPGHDIGIVSMVGEMVRFHMRKKSQPASPDDIKKVYRKARLTDIEKWINAVEMETSIMFRSRDIAVRLERETRPQRGRTS